MFGYNSYEELVLRDYTIAKKDNSDDKDNLPPPNLTSPSSSGLITDASDKSNNSKTNPGKDNQSEAKNNAKTIKFENKENEGKNNLANPTEKSPNETLVINLSDIKRITLTSQGQLIVEFNNSKTHNMTAEQVNNNSELQTIKNYCQKSGKSSLSRFELDKIFSSTNETNTGSVGKPTDNNHALVIGLSVAVALTIGLVIGLLLKRKKSIKRS
ncbi:5247_t:CDS:1 [Entrophospora sp. SA101]|nr:10460_t:CDS:1 [Entrophospora sp. SA101]CAJ0747145.1 5247_t:CDS:1 [Entrophospora sp. SA101]CAJ0830707.1 17592_t:CDS:1 [Entrophospora sp. SA101]CAJ0908516.1 13442_t:CDS:1 [Entrophospora sp. SA101]